MPPRTSRAQDEVALAILAAAPGQAAVAVAEGFGLSASYASTIRQRVLADDLAASADEPEAQVRAAYWFGGAA